MPEPTNAARELAATGTPGPWEVGVGEGDLSGEPHIPAYLDCEWNPACPVHRPVSTRFACRCGRFLAASAIRHADHRDDSRYYGVRTEVEWTCSRCGVVKGEEWEPSLVCIGEQP